MSVPSRVARQGGYEPFESIQREFDGALNRFFGTGGREYGGTAGAMAPYGVDVREDADHLYVEAELPGFKKDDVDITLENHTLTIAAERGETKAVDDQKKGDWLLRERRHTRFLRSFTLPATVSDNKCEAKLNDGVLMITLDKREETKPRKIQVS
jgi:HSP20 family protein